MRGAVHRAEGSPACVICLLLPPVCAGALPARCQHTESWGLVCNLQTINGGLLPLSLACPSPDVMAVVDGALNSARAAGEQGAGPYGAGSRGPSRTASPSRIPRAPQGVAVRPAGRLSSPSKIPSPYRAASRGPSRAGSPSKLVLGGRPAAPAAADENAQSPGKGQGRAGARQQGLVSSIQNLLM